MNRRISGLNIWLLMFSLLFWIVLLTVTADLPVGSSFSKLFPAKQIFCGEAVLLGGNLSTKFTNTITVDEKTGEIEMKTVSPDFEYWGRLNSDLQMEESLFSFKNPDIIKFQGHDKRVTKFDHHKKLLTIRYFLNTQEKGVKEIACEPNTVDSDTLLVFLQGMLLKKAGNFRADVIQKAKGLRVNADFKLVTAEDLQKISPEYSFPPGFVTMTKPAGGANVYIMELTGMPRLFYSYKYYFAYRMEPPYSLIAYWGGAPQETEFSYILN